MAGLKYNIVCIADEAYAQHTAVMLASLFNQNAQKQFRVFLMTYTISEEAKRKLQQVVKGHGELHILEDDYTNSGIMALKSETSTKAWNPIMYLKLLIPQKLPADVERFLFLDVDMIINHDIEELYQTDLGGFSLAACDDYKYQQVHRDRLGLKASELYVNSGVMVIDLKAWRRKEQKCPMIRFLETYKEVLNNDQDGFAIYFRGEIKLLSNQTADKNLAGFRAGLNEHFSLNEKWGLFLEQGMNVYSGKITETARTFYNGKFSAVLSASAGVSYRF